MSELSRYLIFTEQDIGLHLETKEIFNYFLHLYGSNLAYSAWVADFFLDDDDD